MRNNNPISLDVDTKTRIISFTSWQFLSEQYSYWRHEYINDPSMAGEGDEPEKQIASLRQLHAVAIDVGADWVEAEEYLRKAWKECGLTCLEGVAL